MLLYCCGMKATKPVLTYYILFYESRTFLFMFHETFHETDFFTSQLRGQNMNDHLFNVLGSDVSKLQPKKP